VGVYLSIWARKRVARCIRGIQATSAATGWGGYLGNKGAVAVRLRVHDAPLVVVCSHLASGDARGDEQRRNSDVADIMRRCVFENPDAGEILAAQCKAVTPAKISALVLT
jgi:phosphatidylinositol-bisphosphatase